VFKILEYFSIFRFAIEIRYPPKHSNTDITTATTSIQDRTRCQRWRLKRKLIIVRS